MVQEGWRDYVSDFKTIATRPTQTKTVADAVEQEGEKWTHTHGGGLKCKVIATDEEHSWVLTEHGSKVTEFTSSLKPIKPKLTKSQAWDKICESEHEFDIVNRIKQLYDII